MSERIVEVPQEVNSREIMEAVIPIVQEASLLALQMQEDVLRIDIKSDGSPVTHVDRAIEAFLYDRLSTIYPGDGFRGEEDTNIASSSGKEWIIDPIDGTIQFIRGQEFWSILVGLDVDGEGTVGIIAFPARNEIVFASKGSGCWESNLKGTQKLHVSNIASLSDSYILHNGIEFARQAGKAIDLGHLLMEAGAERGYADAFGHMEVVRGRADCMIDFLTEYHDIAPIRIAVTEAGGKWSAIDGSQVLNENNVGSLTSNGLLHEMIRRKLNRNND